MRASANLLFHIPVTGSTTPNSGLDERSDWLCPQTWQYCSRSSISEPQYQQFFTGGIVVLGSRIRTWDGRSGRTLPGRPWLAPSATPGNAYAAETVRGPGRPEAGRGGA